MNKNDKIHDIIYINDDGTIKKKEKFQRVIFIGPNEILKNIRIKKIVFPVVFIFFCFSILATGAKIYAWQNDGEMTKELNKEYINMADITEDEEIDDENITITEPESEPEKDKDKDKDKDDTPKVNDTYYWKFNNVKLLNVDFKKLSKINDETVAWLKVNGTKINYPVVHGKDNKFYLNHTFDKSENSVGWVFLDYRNNGYLTNRNNVIYAHGRLDNVMFGTLENVLNKSWYMDENNRIIKTSTKTHNDLWEVFSIYTIKKESYYIQTGFKSNLDYYNFIQKITKRSIYDFGITVSFTDKILTLSTCSSDNKRIVVHARLIVKKDKVESNLIPDETIDDDKITDETTTDNESTNNGENIKEDTNENNNTDNETNSESSENETTNDIIDETNNG